MSHTITQSTTLDVIECADCHMLFAMTATFQKERRRSHAYFYCPSGHVNFYPHKTVEQERIERLEMRVANLTDDLRAEQAKVAKATKERKRTANGVCPCCNRSFVQLARHMRGQHPEYQPT